jgi:opacity protein-like surface antigen
MRAISLGAACAAALGLLIPAAADAAKRVQGYRFQVVAATHSSSASESGGSYYDYNGTTSESWKLRHRSADVANAGDFAFGSGGLIQLNVRGTYRDEVHTQFGQPGGDPNENNCTLTAPTGSSEFPAVAPDGASVTLTQKTRRSRVKVGWVFPMAALENPYFGTGCSHPDTVFPDDSFFIGSVPAATLRKKRFTLVNAHTPGGKYGNYTWRTAVTLKRVKTYR